MNVKAPALMNYRLVNWLAVFHCATALAFAGILLLAAVVSGFATALVLAGVFACTVMGVAFLFVSEKTCLISRLCGCYSCVGNESAGKNSCECCGGEHGFGVLDFHGFVFCFVVRSTDGLYARNRLLDPSIAADQQKDRVFFQLLEFVPLAGCPTSPTRGFISHHFDPRPRFGDCLKCFVVAL